LIRDPSELITNSLRSFLARGERKRWAIPRALLPEVSVSATHFGVELWQQNFGGVGVQMGGMGGLSPRRSHRGGRLVSMRRHSSSWLHALPRSTRSKSNNISFVSHMRPVVCVGEKGRWNASVLAQIQ
jgi:hypothetical protein